MDTSGNPIYLTNERWEHICERHADMARFEASLRETIRRGRRRQDELNPQKYFYLLSVPNLPSPDTHIEAVVLFRYGVSDDGAVSANNYVATAYHKFLQ